MPIAGAEEVNRKLVELGRVPAGRIVRTALRDGAKVVQTEAQADAPDKTGQLRGAIKVRAGKRSRGTQSVNVVIGKQFFVGDAFYGAFQEFGWRHGSRKLGDARKLIEGKHFMQQAYERRGAEAAEVVMAGITAGIDDVAKGGRA